MTEDKPKGTPKWKWWEDPVIKAFAIILGVIVVCGIVYFYKLAYESRHEADARSAYNAYKTEQAEKKKLAARSIVEADRSRSVCDLEDHSQQQVRENELARL